MRLLGAASPDDQKGPLSVQGTERLQQHIEALVGHQPTDETDERRVLLTEDLLPYSIRGSS